MGLFDLFTNFNPDELVKKFDDFEQALDKTIDNVSSAAEKVENTAEIVEQKLVPGAANPGISPSDNSTDE